MMARDNMWTPGIAIIEALGFDPGKVFEVTIVINGDTGTTITATHFAEPEQLEAVALAISQFQLLPIKPQEEPA